MSRSLARQGLVTRRTGGKNVSHSTTNPRLGGLEHRHDKQAPERKQGFTVRLAWIGLRDTLPIFGFEGGTPAAFGALIHSETEKWAKVVRQAGIRPE